MKGWVLGLGYLRVSIPYPFPGLEYLRVSIPIPKPGRGPCVLNNLPSPCREHLFPVATITQGCAGPDLRI